ncbi:MAG TPA: DUF2336 domain-containing protein [Acetobacteraceae bacterium]|jgi:uncharacterized protein (DUF2336 family)|nr:DUF2336 domain-containing protein [Acetobacteraceae bacterium]
MVKNGSDGRVEADHADAGAGRPPSRFTELLARAERERSMAVTPEVGAAKAAARLVVALREVCRDNAEMQLAATVLLDLLVQTSVEVRAVLAIEIGGMENAPAELVERLALDEDPGVAEGVILASPVLDDDALLRIVRQKARGHRMAVARRPRLGDKVATALARSGEAGVLVALAANRDSTLSQPVLAWLAMEAARFPALAAPLVHRADLPPDIANDLVSWVTEVAVEEAVASGVSGRLAIEAGRRASARLQQSKGARAGAADALASKAVAAAADAGVLCGDFVLDAFRSGAVAAGVTALSRLAHVPVEHARACVDEGDPDRLAALCRAARLTHDEFVALRTALGLAEGRQPSPSRADYEITPEHRAVAAVTCGLHVVWGNRGMLRA